MTQKVEAANTDSTEDRLLGRGSPRLTGENVELHDGQGMWDGAVGGWIWISPTHYASVYGHRYVGPGWTAQIGKKQKMVAHGTGMGPTGLIRKDGCWALTVTAGPSSDPPHPSIGPGVKTKAAPAGGARTAAPNTKPVRLIRCRKKKMLRKARRNVGLSSFVGTAPARAV